MNLLRILRKKNAQSVGEYTVVITLAILAISGMTIFLQRGFSARMNDARAYMMETLDDDIKQVHLATGGTSYEGIKAEYEPYYQRKQTNVTTDSDSDGYLNGVSGQYSRQDSSTTTMNIISNEGAAGIIPGNPNYPNPFN